MLSGAGGGASAGADVGADVGADAGVDAGADAGGNQELPQLKEEIPKVVRKKAMTDEERYAEYQAKQQAAMAAESDKLKNELSAQQAAEAKEEAELKDAAAADRVSRVSGGRDLEGSK